MQKLHFPNSSTRTTSIGELVHSDVCGPMEEQSPGRARYFVLFKDDFSGWTEVRFIKTKDEVFGLFQQLTAIFKTQYNCNIRTLRTDNGGEFKGKDFEEWLAVMGTCTSINL